jgi:PAS domain S-box-containing protein
LEATLAGLEARVAERTASLREGEERLRLAIDAGRFGTWETDLATGMTTRSERSQDILGLPADAPDAPISEWEARIHPTDRGRVRAAWDQVATGRVPSYRIEYRFQRPDGAWRWLESNAAVVRRDPASGLPLRLAGTNRDITERREAEDRRDLLTKEVNHRARNTLAIVQAILRLTRAEDAAGYARLIEGRIAALARAQSLLAAERWTGAPLGTLLSEELAPFGGAEEGAATGARFGLEGPPLRLRAEVVQPLGMVVHELATNAAKHGALSTPAGRVAVSWEADEQSGLLRIRWAETGGPAPVFPQSRGVGSRVIEATVTGQLGGSVERRWPEAGLVCDIALPLARMRAGPV